MAELRTNHIEQEATAVTEKSSVADTPRALSNIRKLLAPILAATAVMGVAETSQAEETTTIATTKNATLKLYCDGQLNRLGNTYICDLGNAGTNKRNGIRVEVAGRGSCDDLNKGAVIDGLSQGVKQDEVPCSAIKSDINNGVNTRIVSLTSPTATDNGAVNSSATVQFGGTNYTTMWTQAPPNVTAGQARKIAVEEIQNDKANNPPPAPQPVIQPAPQPIEQALPAENKPWINLNVGYYASYASRQSTDGQGYYLSSQYNIPFDSESDWAGSMGVELTTGTENMLINNVISLDPDQDSAVSKIGAGPGLMWHPIEELGFDLHARAGLMIVTTGSTPTIHNDQNEVWELGDSSQYLPYGSLGIGPIVHIGPVDLAASGGLIYTPTGYQIPKDEDQKLWWTWTLGAGFNTK